MCGLVKWPIPRQRPALVRRSVLKSTRSALDDSTLEGKGLEEALPRVRGPKEASNREVKAGQTKGQKVLAEWSEVP